MTDQEKSARTEIAARLRLAREGAGLTQAQVARMIGLHRPSISEIEAGRRRVSADELARLAEIYDVSIEWITSSQDLRTSDAADERVRLVARELSRLKDDDLDRLMTTIQMLRRSRSEK